MFYSVQNVEYRLNTKQSYWLTYDVLAIIMKPDWSNVFTNPSSRLILNGGCVFGWMGSLCDRLVSQSTVCCLAPTEYHLSL
ncbi:hypothetical protein V1477_013790 [Vespula maculifrons]|uniref:Uncharacterized protein n=1 Tax=Vespula maculifrons TaxID=7453 RepID=A0ABD2BQR4_VESMC